MKNHIKKLFFLCILPFLASACTETPERFKDGYQIGDVTMTVVDKLPRIQQKLQLAKEAYCSPGATEIVRTLALDVVRTYFPMYPAGGICSMDIIEQIAKLYEQKERE